MAHEFALITGASSGIGAAFAKGLPAATAVLLTGRDEASLAKLADAMAGAGRQVETHVADLSEQAGRDALIARASDLPIDLLINNAGLGAFGAFAQSPPEREAEMIQVNCLAPVLLTRALLPGMLERARESGRRGGVVMVASTAAFFPLPWLTTYAATKAFDLVFAESLAGELRREPVDVLALCPGATRTNFFARAGFASDSPFATISAEQVAREGLAALGRRTVHVVGGANRLAAVGSRFAPRSWLRAGARGTMSRLTRDR